jgi:pimeloyl-ACP methyl ester carboxylesterase
MSERTHDVPAADGRTLHVLEAGEPDGACVVVHHGTPMSGALFAAEIESARERGLRLVAYDRPGYGESSPDPGRSVADAAADVAAILDALGVARFATYGASGGGPHALACAALLGDRCAAALTIAGVGPADAADLEFLAGMGEGNQIEFGKALDGREALAAFLRDEAAGLLEVRPEQLADAMRPHLSDVDARALTGELAEFLTHAMQRGLGPGIDGWLDDDLAFMAPWGFDVGAIGVPVAVWQGEHDLMVPPAHAAWLGGHVPGADLAILAGEGHLTLQVTRIGDAHAWLAGHLD